MSKVHLIKFTKTSFKENITTVQGVKGPQNQMKFFECMVCDKCFETKKDLSEHHLAIHE